MATRKPLVIVDGDVEQLPDGDTLDASIQSGLVLTNRSGGASVIGTPIYISGAGEFQLARANTRSTGKVFGLVADTTIPNNTPGKIQTDDILTATTGQWNAVTGQSGGLTPGAKYYLSAAIAGRLTSTAPTGDGEGLICVGTAIDTISLKLSIQPAIWL